MYRHVYGSKFPLEFQLELGTNGSTQSVHNIVHLSELNNRTDYAIEGIQVAIIGCRKFMHRA